MLQRVYELETAIFRSIARKAELKEAVAQGKYALREAKIAQVEYSGIRAILDKLSGKYADQAEVFSREVRKAEAELSALEQQLKAETQKLSALQEQRASLPPLEQLRTPEVKEIWAPLEIRLCAEILSPLLTQLGDALTEYRKMLRGEFPMLSVSQQQDIVTAPIAAAERCQPLLQRLEAAGAELEPGDFFRCPAGFLAAAARHNQLNQAAQAATQTTRLTNTLRRYL